MIPVFCDDGEAANSVENEFHLVSFSGVQNNAANIGTM